MLKKIFILLCCFILIGLSIAYSATPATPTDLDEPPKNKNITLKINVYLEGQLLKWASKSYTQEWKPNNKHSVNGYLATHDICKLVSVTLNGSSYETTDQFFVNSNDFEDGDIINANFYYEYTDWKHSYNVTVKHIFDDPNYPGEPMIVDKSFTATPGSHIDVASYSRGHFYFKVSSMPGGAWYLGWFEYVGGQHNSVYGTTSSTDPFGVIDTMIHQNVDIKFYYYFYPITEPSPTDTPIPATQTDLEPTTKPTAKPTVKPTVKPTKKPTPTPKPTKTPKPTTKPTKRPTATPVPTPTTTVWVPDGYLMGISLFNQAGDCIE